MALRLHLHAIPPADLKNAVFQPQFFDGFGKEAFEGKEPVAVIISSPAMAASFRKGFDSYWEAAGR